MVSHRVLTIPNIISIIRLAGVPLFLWLDPRPRGGRLGARGAVHLRGQRLRRRLPGPQAQPGLEGRGDPRPRRGPSLHPLDRRSASPRAASSRGGWRSCLPARDAFLWCLVPFLRTRGYSSLPVHFLGKAATANLLYAFPLLLLGDGDGSLATLAKVFGWAFAIWGIRPLLVGGPAVRLAGAQADRRPRPKGAGPRWRLSHRDAPGASAGRSTAPRTMGLLDHLTATSLDEDYAHVSRRRDGDRRRRRRDAPAARRWSSSRSSACWSRPPPCRPRVRRTSRPARAAASSSRRTSTRPSSPSVSPTSRRLQTPGDGPAGQGARRHPRGPRARPAARAGSAC